MMKTFKQKVNRFFWISLIVLGLYFSYLLVEPAFGDTYGYIQRPDQALEINSANNDCDGTNTDPTFNADSSNIIERPIGGNDHCQNLILVFDISGIPNGATITDVDLRYDISSIGGTPPQCEFREITVDTSDIASLVADDRKAIWEESLPNAVTPKSNTNYILNDAGCQTASTGKTIDLGTDADLDLQEDLEQGTFAVAFTYETQLFVTPADFSAIENPELQVIFTMPTPIAINDLTYVYDEDNDEYDFTIKESEKDDSIVSYYLDRDSSPEPYIQPITHLRFDGSIVDIGSNPSTVNYTDGLITPTYIASPLGLGLNFTNTEGDYLHLEGDGSKWNFEQLPFTVAFWYKMGDSTTSFHLLVDHLTFSSTTDEDGGWQMYLKDSGSRSLPYPDSLLSDEGEYCLNFVVEDEDNTTTRMYPDVNADVHCDDNLIELGHGWHHYVFTYNGGTQFNDNADIYIDGVSQCPCHFTNTKTVTGWNHNEDLGIGDDNEDERTTGVKAKGIFDDFRVYDVELTSTQVSTLHQTTNHFKETYPAESTLAGSSMLEAYWKFDGNLFDSTGKGFDGHVAQGGEYYTNSEWNYGKELMLTGNDIIQFNNFTENFISGITLSYDVFASGINFESREAFSFTFFISNQDYSDNGEQNDQVIISKKLDSTIDGTDDIGYYVAVEDEQLYFYIDGSTSVQLVVRSSETVSSGHYTITYDGSKLASGVTMYKDGSGLTEVTVTDTLSTGTDCTHPGAPVGVPCIINQRGLTIGAFEDLSNPLKADLDELRIYSKELTADEVNLVYSLSGYSETTGFAFSDDTVTDPRQYNYTAFAQGIKIISDKSNEVRSVPAPDDLIPSLMSGTTSAGQAVLSWGEPASYASLGVDGYYMTKDGIIEPWTVTTQPLAYWRFDGNETGKTSYGTASIDSLQIIGTEDMTATGEISNGFDFDGSTYLQTTGDIRFASLNFTTSDETNFDFDQDDAFSISLWTNNGDDTGNKVFVAKGGDIITTQGWYFFQNTGTPFLSLFNTDTTDEIRVKSSIFTNSSSLQHVVMTNDGSATGGGVNFYIDGTLDASPTIQRDTLSSTILNDLALTIGGDNEGNSDSMLTGILDEVRVYDVELTSTQVTNIFNYNSTTIQLSTVFTETGLTNGQTYTYNIHGFSNEAGMAGSTTSFTCIIDGTDCSITGGGSGGSGGAGGGSDRSGFFQITVNDINERLTIGQNFNGILKFHWTSALPLRILEFNFNTNELGNIKFTPQDIPTFLAGDSDGVSDAELSFRLNIPNEYCTQIVRTNCVDDKIHEITGTIVIQHSSEVINQGFLMKLDLRKGFPPEQALILVGIIAGIATIGIIRVAVKKRTTTVSHKRR